MWTLHVALHLDFIVDQPLSLVFCTAAAAAL